MEGLSPLLGSILEVEYALKSGRSVRVGIESYVGSTKNDWSTFLKAWLPQFERGEEICEIEGRLNSSHRRVFLSLVKAGLRGQSVAKELSELKSEALASTEREIEHFIRTLPFKLLVPLLFFMFPAFMMLLMGPILENLMESM